MIEDFGGTVTGSVSGKTDYIVVGKEPGRKKVSEGEKRGIPLLGLMSLRKLLTGDDIAGDEPGKLAVFFFRFLFLVSSVNSHRLQCESRIFRRVTATSASSIEGCETL